MDGERRLTNYLQLGELLQQADARALGLQGLVDWLGQRIAGAGRLAEQPAEKCTHSCHGVVIPFRRRSRQDSPW